MGEAVSCEQYVALLEAIRDALVGIDDEPDEHGAGHGRTGNRGGPRGRGPRHADLREPAPSVNQHRALQGKSALEELPDEEQPE